MADIERMRRVLAHIEKNSRLWRQDTWVSDTECGTAYCFAGWTLTLEGIQIVKDDNGIVYVDVRELPELWRDKVQTEILGCMYGDSHLAAVSDVASVVLGLCTAKGRPSIGRWRLFGACATLDDLRREIDSIEANGLVEDRRFMASEY